MSFFPKTLKLYHFFKKDLVKLSIKVSDQCVLCFHIDGPTFQQMITQCYSPTGYSDKAHFVFQKKEYLRFSRESHGSETHLRVETEKWAQLVADYKEKLKTPEGDHFSCEVD